MILPLCHKMSPQIHFGKLVFPIEKAYLYTMGKDMIIETLRSQLEASNMTIRQMSSTIDNLQQTISDLRKTVANLESLLKERVIKEKLTK